MRRWLSALLLVAFLAGCRSGADQPMIPQVQGPWWTVARTPDLGELNGPPTNEPHAVMQPVDFAVWQAADGTWQLWSCIRGTKCGGRSRLLYGWEGARLTDADWSSPGIRMQADPAYGETPGGLQAPHVVLIDGVYHMFYGDWVNLCIARGTDGKTFERWLMPDGRAGMFNEGEQSNARDAMAMRIGDLWYCYYTAHPGNNGAVYCRTSADLRTWSEPRIVARGGLTGGGPYACECPHVVYHRGYYYLFRTQRYAGPPTTSVYRSKDPLDFGVDDDSKFVCLMEVAAPEIVYHEDEWFVAALLPDIQGIRIARMRWIEDHR